MSDRSRRSKILFVEAGEGKGGSSIFLYYLLKYLDREKFDPFVVFNFYNTGPDTMKIQSLGVPVFFLNTRKTSNDYLALSILSGNSQSIVIHKIMVLFRFLIKPFLIEIPQIFRMVRLVKKKSIVLVVLNNDVHYNLPGVVSARLTGVPCICRKAGGIGEGKLLKQFLTPWVDLFIAISKATASDQLKNNPSTRKLVMLQEGVDLKAFDITSKNLQISCEFGLSPQNKVVGQIARFEKGKGQKELIEAAALVKEKYQNVIFLIVGDDPNPEKELINQLRKRVADLGLEKSVIFTGWRNDIQEILSVIDIFVHCPTTWIEGLGIGNLEAMAMGKPTVVSNNGGLRDAVIDGVTGIVVPAGDQKKMAEAILTLLTNEDLAARFGKNARSRAEQEFDVEKNTKVLESYFEEYALGK